MAAPAFGSVGTRYAASTSTPAIAVPASVAAGDIIVCYIWTNGTVTVTGRPAGFAAAEGSPANVAGNPAGACNLSIEWKRATGADSGTYDFTTSASDFVYARAIRYTSCVAAGNPWDTPISEADSGSDTGTAPAVSINTAGADRLLVYAASDVNGDSGTWTAPSGFSEREGGVNAVNFEQSDKVQAVQGGSGTVQATNTFTTDPMGAWLGALIGTTAAAGNAQAGPAETFLPGATLFDSSAFSPLGSLYRESPLQTPSGAAVTLDGSAPAAADLDGGLVLAQALAGSTPAAASATGPLAVAQALAGSANAANGATGALSVAQALAGSAPAAAGATADLTVTAGGAVPLAGSTPASAGATGALSVVRGIAGSTPAAAGATGALSVVRGIDGSTPAAAYASGSLRLQLAAAGAAPTAAYASGSLRLQLAAAGAAAAAATLTGSLTVGGGAQPAAAVAAYLQAPLPEAGFTGGAPVAPGVAAPSSPAGATGGAPAAPGVIGGVGGGW